jgi:hypothetical protein
MGKAGNSEVSEYVASHIDVQVIVYEKRQ